MEKKRFRFKVTLCGEGEDKQEAETNAIMAFINDLGDLGEATEFCIECDEVPTECICKKEMRYSSRF